MGQFVVGYLHNGNVSGLFAQSLANLMLTQHAHVAGFMAKHCGVNVSGGRNELARSFLSSDSWPEAQWLLMLDADIEFTPDQATRLLRTAERGGPGIYSGLYFGSRHSQAFPLIYQEQGGQVVQVGGYPEGDLVVPIAGTGAGFMLVHRSVFESVEPAHSPVFPWFAEEERDGQYVSEDITFCLRAKGAGFPVWMDLGIKVGHHKMTVVNEAMFLEQAATQDA